MAASFAAMADCTLYLFYKGYPNTETKIRIDGTELCNLDGTVKKSKNVTGFKYPQVFRESCFRKVYINTSGKLTLELDMDFQIIKNGDHKTYDASMTLDAADGATYYVQVTSKGLNKMQFKDVSEKDANKWMDQWEKLAPVTYPKADASSVDDVSFE